MSKKTLYLHIGYPKTATTSLQDYFFSQLTEVEYIGKPYKREWQKNLYDIIFKGSKINLKIQSKSKKLIWSEENFLKFQFYKDNAIIKRLEKIKNIFFGYEIIILITLRKHSDLLKSTFQQFQEELIKNKINVFELSSKNQNSNLNENYISFIEMFDFYNLYQNLLKLFNKNQIHFLFYEKLVENENKFLNEINQILNLETKNLILKKKNQTNQKYKFSHVIKRFLKYLIKILKKKHLINFLFIHRYFYFIKVILSYSFPRTHILNIQKLKHFKFFYTEVYFDNLKKFKDPVQKNLKDYDYFNN